MALIVQSPEEQKNIIDKMLKSRAAGGESILKKTEEQGFSNYGQEFQLQVLSLLIQNKQFSYRIKDILESKYFDSKYTQWVCERTLEYLTKYKTNPKISDLKITCEEEFIGAQPLKVLHLKILESIEKVDLANKDFIQEKAINFCFTKHRLAEIEKEKAHIMSGDFDKAKTIAQQSYKPINENGREIDLKKDIDAILNSQNHINMVPTPFPTFNANMKGGPGAGDLVIICAQSHLGKSMLGAAWANHAATEKKNVLYFSLETKGEQLAERTLAALTGMDQHLLRSNSETVKAKLKDLPANIKFVQFKATKATTDALKEKINDLKSGGFFPDIIFVDGLNQLKLPKGISFSNSNDKFEYLAEELRDLANDEQVPLAAMFQLNRSGFSNVVADEQSIGKAIEVFQVCDQMYILTQDPAMFELNQCYITALKNRLGKKGIMLKLQYEPSRCLFKEIEEVSRNEIISAQQAKQLGKGIDLMQTTLRKKSAENLKV